VLDGVATFLRDLIATLAEPPRIVVGVSVV
jgi:hypothetical protein